MGDRGKKASSRKGLRTPASTSSPAEDKGKEEEGLVMEGYQEKQ